MAETHDTMCGCDICVEAEHQAEVSRLRALLRESLPLVIWHPVATRQDLAQRIKAALEE